MPHTPGPWTMKEGDAERREMSHVFKADDPEYLIAYVMCEWRNQHQRAQDLADARLIAAAPDLLAALQFAFAHCNPTQGREEEWRCIPAAIRKATGQ